MMPTRTTPAARLMVFAVAALMISLLAIGQAAAADITMEFRSVAPPGTPWAQQLNRLKKDWEARAKEKGHNLTVKVILGRDNEESLVRKCRAGSVQAIGVSTAAMSTEVPEMGAFELPYLFKNHAEADRLIDTVLFAPIEKLLGEYGYQLYIFSENGFRNFAVRSDSEIKSFAPADLAKFKMRSQDNWIHEATYSALGGNPVRVPTPEVLTSLEGQTNGFDNTPLFAFATSWYTKINTWIVSDHIYQPAVVVYSKTWFDAQPKELQEILLSNRVEETKRGRVDIRKLGPALIGQMSGKGIKVYNMTDAEKGVFASKTKGVYDEFRKRNAKNKGPKLLDLILKSK